MGANAQTSVPTFTAGQVLTAAQMNDSARTGVPVFADASARDAGFGGTGEKTLAEGQLAYLEDLDVVQYYDGSSWATLAPTTPGLELVSSTTIGTTVASVTVTGAFSATYENYYITISGGVASTNANLRMTLGATTTGYYEGGIGLLYSGSSNSGGGANIAYWDVGYGTTNSLMADTRVFSPELAKTTSFTSQQAASRTDGFSLAIGGYLNNTTQYTDFTITASTGTLTGGTIRVYGFKN